MDSSDLCDQLKVQTRSIAGGERPAIAKLEYFRLLTVDEEHRIFSLGEGKLILSIRMGSGVTLLRAPVLFPSIVAVGLDVPMS